MRQTISSSLCIDVRRIAEVLMLGPLEWADAHIPYVAIDRDEWSECMKAFRNQSNNAFLLHVDDLVIEHGLNRGSCVSLIASTYHQGVMAANVLSVAGYANLFVEVGRCHDSTVRSTVIREKSDVTAGSHAGYQWTNTTCSQLGGLLH